MLMYRSAFSSPPFQQLGAPFLAGAFGAKGVFTAALWCYRLVGMLRTWWKHMAITLAASVPNDETTLWSDCYVYFQQLSEIDQLWQLWHSATLAVLQVVLLYHGATWCHVTPKWWPVSRLRWLWVSPLSTGQCFPGELSWTEEFGTCLYNIYNYWLYLTICAIRTYSYLCYK